MMANFLRETYYVLLALMATEEFAFLCYWMFLFVQLKANIENWELANTS